MAAQVLLRIFNDMEVSKKELWELTRKHVRSWFRVEDKWDLIPLIFKLIVVIVIMGEIYDAGRYVLCLLASGYDTGWVFFYFIKCVLFVCYLLILYRVAKWFKKKPDLWIVPVLFVILNMVAFWYLGSIAGVYYFNGPYWGQVVDADTGEPIAGANVVGYWKIDFGVIKSRRTFADARETITNDNGRFFLPPGRRVWLWPLSEIIFDALYVFKQGYDSHPPNMDQAWSVEDKEKWNEKLNKILPEYLHDRDVGTKYSVAFRVLPENRKPYKKIMIKLNKALSLKEQEEALHVYYLSDAYLEKYKIRHFLDAIETAKNQQRKR